MASTFRPLCGSYIFSSYIFQSEFTFWLPLFSVHHRSLFLIAFNFPSQRWRRHDDNDNNVVLKNDLSHMMWLCCQRHTHIWKMIIAFGLWILAYFCNKQNAPLPTHSFRKRAHMPLTILHHVVKCALTAENCCRECWTHRKNRKSSFSFVSFSWLMWSVVKTVNKNWVIFENYSQVTLYVARHGNIVYSTYCKMIVGEKGSPQLQHITSIRRKFIDSIIWHHQLKFC